MPTVNACFFLALAIIASTSSTQTRNADYRAALEALDWNAVKADILTVLTNSRTFWPADYGNYGPFLIRQAWHCSGSYRGFDGHGGCDGGRQRFDPERSWDDNTNLDKAKTLLWPIKQKYGRGLSWGDLMIFAANTAIESMGGPVLGFCAGRQDDNDGSASILLGPDWRQNKTNPCPVNGNCKLPFGSTTIGLIYLNPEGPMGQPIPRQSAPQIRDVFGRMGLDDTETVALIGGGHAFGKSHGACPLGPGPSPKVDPANPWPGKCGSGKGKDTFTSGFEGPWTQTPTKWSNSYYRELLHHDWEVHIGPGGHNQWRTVGGPQSIMMLTTDISLLHDPSYLKLVQGFASNISFLNYQFMHAWYKLTTRDMGPVTRCAGPFVPPAQPFQNPLPNPPTSLPPFDLVRKDIWTLINTDQSGFLNPDYYNGKAYYGGVFVQLAWACASTFRHTDYLGGCNGARIRFDPELNWSTNVAMDRALQLLRPIQQRYTNLSWADLIVLAGNVALDMASGTTSPMAFCGGRTDASDGSGSKFLQPLQNFSATADQVRAQALLMGFNDREIVALSARLRSPAQMQRTGYFGSYTTNPTLLSNEYFLTLLNEQWVPYPVTGSGIIEYKAVGKQLFMLPQDMALKWDSSYMAIAEDFASDNNMFITEFQAAWTKLMNIDRFAGPTGNVCH